MKFGNVAIERRVPCVMRDGITLYADIYTPAVPGPHPVLLMRQPYGRALASTVSHAHPVWYADKGYMVVIQDVRGRGSLRAGLIRSFMRLRTASTRSNGRRGFRLKRQSRHVRIFLSGADPMGGSLAPSSCSCGNGSEHVPGGFVSRHVLSAWCLRAWGSSAWAFQLARDTARRQVMMRRSCCAPA